MARNRVTYGAIPISDDGTEMMGTHGSVRVGDRSVLAHVVYGEYVSRETFIRYMVGPNGTPGVTYKILRGGFSQSSREDGRPYRVPGDIAPSSKKIAPDNTVKISVWVRKIARRPNTVNGNPRFTIYGTEQSTTTEREYFTKPDTAEAAKINEWDGVYGGTMLADLTLNMSGLVVGFTEIGR